MGSPAAAAIELFVRRLTSRSVLTSDEEDAIHGLKGEVQQIVSHRDFVQLGQPVDHCCLVMDGLVGRFGQRRDGARQITCLYIPGDLADLSSVVSPKSAWGLSALTGTTLYRVPHVEIRRIAALHPGIAEALWRDCIADGSIFSEWVVNVGRRSSATRVAHLLCEMAIRYERCDRGNRNSFAFPITQLGLGDATGLTAVHTNRTLKSLRMQSGVTVRDKTVTIPDWNQLASIGEFKADYLLFDGPAPPIIRMAKILSSELHY
ncbi:Crp/Fnr family transcriptional regulator [Sphingomonas sp. GB1N7]|uniref:Crp/Fnr family transcriptional regulator n=1 Tax=Parasphingomonas caseinilytica TaxID=3096158 RepID=UPI002FC628E0